jgi:hypothetical protein
MRWRVPLSLIIASSLGVAPVRSEEPLQTRYLNIYLKINEAEQFEKKGDYRGALEDFKDCYMKLSKIQRENPDWEKALVIHRLADCSAKIQELGPKAAMQAPAELPPPTLPSTSLNADSGSNGTTPGEDVNQLRLELQAARDELGVTRSQAGHFRRRAHGQADDGEQGADGQARLRAERDRFLQDESEVQARARVGAAEERAGPV